MKDIGGFLGVRKEGGGIMKERGIVFFITNAMEGIKKLNKFGTLHGKS
jgi:hypothetical protein